MQRNLDRRVEVAFIVEDEDIKKEVCEIMDLTLADNVKARLMQSDGTYKRVDRRGKEPIHSQMLFYDRAIEKNRSEKKEKTDIFIPMISPTDEE